MCIKTGINESGSSLPPSAEAVLDPAAPGKMGFSVYGDAEGSRHCFMCSFLIPAESVLRPCSMPAPGPLPVCTLCHSFLVFLYTSMGL